MNGFNCDIIETGIDTNSLQEYVKYTQSLNQFKIRRLVEGICPGKWEDFQVTWKMHLIFKKSWELIVKFNLKNLIERFKSSRRMWKTISTSIAYCLWFIIKRFKTM